MPPAHFLNAPTYRRRHHGGSGAHRRRDRGDHQKLLISLLILCKTEDVSTSSVLFYCQTLSLRASPQTGVAIRIPSLSPSVGVGVPDDPHAQPPCHAVGATLAVARRTFNPCHCEPARTLVWQSVPPRISCIFLRRAGFPHPAADKHSTPQTLSLRAHSAVAIRIPSLSPSVGVGVPDDPHAQPPCHAVGATLAVARRTPQTLSLRASAHTGVAIRTPLA